MGDDGAGGQSGLVGDVNADDFGGGADEAVLADGGFEEQGLHADEGVVADDGGAVDLTLVGQGDALADVDGVILAVDLAKVFFDGFAILGGFQGVEDDLVLDVGFVTDEDWYAFITANGSEGADENFAAELNVTDY